MRTAIGVNSALNGSLYSVRDVETEEDYKRYRLAVGHVIAEVFERIIEPIGAQHPELTPPEMKE